MLLELFWVFLKIGAVTFGGGYAMIALIQSEVVGRGWCTPMEFADMAAAAQMTPGPISLNTATYVGLKIGGISGAAVATLGFIVPSLVIASAVSLFLHHARKNRWVEGALSGVRAAAIGLVFAAVLFFLENSVFSGELPLYYRDFSLKGFSALEWNILPLAVFVLILTATALFRLKPLPAVVVSLVLGAGFSFFL